MYPGNGAAASSARCAQSSVVIAGALGSGVENTSWLMRSTYVTRAFFPDSCKYYNSISVLTIID